MKGKNQVGIFILSGDNLTSLLIEEELKKICKKGQVNYTPTFNGTWATVLSLDEVSQVKQSKIKIKPLDHETDDNNGLIYAALKINAFKKSTRFPT